MCEGKMTGAASTIEALILSANYAPRAHLLLLIPSSIPRIYQCPLFSYLQKYLRLLAGPLTRRFAGAYYCSMM